VVMVAKRTPATPGEPVSESVRTLRDASARFAEVQASLDHHLDEAGLGGMTGVSQLLAQVNRLLAPIGDDELARARAEVDAGIVRLEAVQTELAHLAELKRRLSA
jgi:hypothetical protein